MRLERVADEETIEIEALARDAVEGSRLPSIPACDHFGPRSATTWTPSTGIGSTRYCSTSPHAEHT